MAKSKRKAAAKKAAEMQKAPQETVEVVAETQKTYEEIVSVPDAAEEVEVEIIAETVAQNLGADQVKMRSVVAECWFSGHCLKEGEAAVMSANDAQILHDLGQAEEVK